MREEQEIFKLDRSGSDLEESSSEADEESEFDETDPFMAEDDYVSKELPVDSWNKPITGPKKAFPGFDDNPRDKVIFEGDIDKENKRIFLRHRIDIAKMYFEKDGGYTLRELKRIYKLEMEENPERYTLELPEDQQATKAMEAKAKQA